MNLRVAKLALAAQIARFAGCDAAPPVDAPGSVASGSAPDGSATVAPSATLAANGPDPKEGSALALVPSGRSLLVADEDHRTLTTLPLPLTEQGAPTKIELPGAPAQLVVLGRTVLVTVRVTETGEGALLFFDREDGGALTPSGRVALPPDAWGLATSPDGRRALVTSAWSAKVSAVDLEKRAVLWTRDVAREPRGVIFIADDTAFVSHLVGSNLTRIRDLGGEAIAESVELPAAPMRSPAADKLSASLGYALVANPSRDRIFAPRHALGTLGTTGWFGGAAVDALDVRSGKPVATARTWQVRKSFVEPFASQIAESAAWWSGGVTDYVDLRFTVFRQPRAAVYRRTSDTILVASEGTNGLAEVDALLGDPTLGLVQTYDLNDQRKPAGSGACAAPSAVALSEDEGTAFVYCRASDSVIAVVLADDSGGYAAPPPSVVRVADPPANADYAAGRKLFYDANDSYVSGGLACAGCHPEGRDDGYVWHEVTFADEKNERGFTNFFGSASAAREMAAVWKHTVANATEAGVGHARQTPMLVGRLNAKGPYGWLAESDTLEERIVASFGLHRWNTAEKSAFATARARQLVPFVREGLVPPPKEASPLTKEEALGKQIFESERAACASCHTPDSDYTNRSVAAFPGVAQRGYAEEKSAAFKTPSLLFVRGSAPYFHDGRYTTLEEVVERNGDTMGKTSHLSADEKKALVAFLRRL